MTSAHILDPGPDAPCSQQSGELAHDPSGDSSAFYPAEPGHPSGHTVEQALAYVADRRELCTPSERTLAREVETLRAAYAATLRHNAEMSAELLIARDAAGTARTAADTIGDSFRYLYSQADQVVGLWRKVDPDSEAGVAARRCFRAYAPGDLVGELDELAERVQ